MRLRHPDQDLRETSRYLPPPDYALPDSNRYH
jgi:hypothetical protein